MPLNEAAEVINRVLRNEQVVVTVSTTEVAHDLANSLQQIGLAVTDMGD